ALAQARDLPELAAHLLDHLVGSPADSVDREGGEDEREHGTEEEPDEHLDLAYIEADRLAAGGEYGGLEGLDQGQGGESRRADREALGHRGSGVAEAVEAVGHLPHLRR